MLGLPPGAGVALGFIAGVSVGALLSPFGIFALPFLLQASQSQNKGGESMVFSENDEWIKIYPLDEDKRTVSSVFSRAPYFAVVKGSKIPGTRGHLLGIYPNPYRDSSYGAARMIVEYLMQFHPNEIVVKSIGRNAETYFRQLGVEVRRIS